MQKLTLKPNRAKQEGLSSLKSLSNSYSERVKNKDKVEYKDLGVIICYLYKAGYKVKWKQPLSKDIYREFREAIPHDVMTSRKLYDAIGFLVRSVKYLLKVRPGVARYDINGNKAGVVTEAESKHALKQLLEHHSEYMRDRRKRQKKVIKATTTVTTRKPYKPGEKS